MSHITANKTKAKRRFKLTPGRITIYVMFVVFAVYAVTLIFPFAWMLMNSFKGRLEFFDSPFSWPEGFVASNYVTALFHFGVTAGTSSYNLVQMFGFSLLITAGGTFLTVFMSTLLAYTVCKYKFRGRGIIYAMVIFALVVPLVGTLPSLYRLMDKIKLLNTIPGILLLYASGYGFSFLLLYGFFKSISWSYAEAAFIDGASDYGVFFKIMLPIAKPALIAVAIIGGIGIWNDYSTPAIFLRSYPTLAVGVDMMVGKMEQENNYPVLFAAMLMAVLPIIIVFSAFQKTIMENTIAGGLKG